MREQKLILIRKNLITICYKVFAQGFLTTICMDDKPNLSFDTYGHT